MSDNARVPTMSMMIRVNSNDAERLRQHRIVCHHARKTEDNWICLPENAASRGLLNISIGGDRNEITITGSHLPTGTIHLVENDSKAEISCYSEVNFTELWLYGRSRFYLDESRAVFGLHAYVYNDTTLSIGKNCLISDHVRIWTSDHHSIIDLATLRQINFPGDVFLRDQVWIGQGVTILKGVEIGEGSIVASCALVTCSIPRTELWGGVPARCLRRNVSWVGSHPAVRSHVEALTEAGLAGSGAEPGGVNAPRASGDRPPAAGRDTQIGQVTARISELEARLSGLQEALARKTTDDIAGRIKALQAENNRLRERLDQLTHGVESWLMPTLEKHAVAIQRRRHPLRQLYRWMAQLVGLF